MRVPLSGAILVVLIALNSHSSVANASSMNLCIKNYFKSLAANAAPSGIARSDAEELIRQIGRSIGLTTGITVIDCDLATKAESWSAPAGIPGIPVGDYIIYDPEWVREVIGKDHTEAVVVFAHELGHLLGRHFTSRSNLSFKERELEADAFAGCAVATQKGDWNQLVDLLHRIRHETEPDAASYPTDKESIAAARIKYDDCGGTPPVQKPLFLEYMGPPLTSTPDELTTRYPSGSWRKNSGQTGQFSRQFDYVTTILNRPATITFFFGNKEQANASEVQDVSFLFKSEYSMFSSQRGTSKTGIASEPAELCGNFFQRLLAELQGKVGKILDRPVTSTGDMSEKLQFSSGWCDEHLWTCTKSATLEKTVVKFETSLDLTLYKSLYQYRRNEQGLDADHFSNSNGSRCWITIDVKRPAALLASKK